MSEFDIEILIDEPIILDVVTADEYHMIANPNANITVVQMTNENIDGGVIF